MKLPEMAQDTDEFAWLLDRLRPLQPRSILEIGVWEGGTIARFRQEFPSAVIVGIDPRPGPQADVFAHIVRGASQGEDERRRALSFTNGSFDFVHIDGDHTMPAARSDFEWAVKHTTKAIALHDIASLGNPQIDCRELWEEIEMTMEETAAIGYPENRDYGIGVVYL